MLWYAVGATEVLPRRIQGLMSVYLLIDLAAVSIPFLFSFHPKISFHRQWKYAFPALILAAIPYLIWDQWFTETGVWGFSPEYHGSIMIGAMPLEEVLFFLCIPYACLFTYWSMQQLTSVAVPDRWLVPLYGFLFLVFTVMMVIGHDQWYTLIDGAFAFRDPWGDVPGATRPAATLLSGVPDDPGAVLHDQRSC